jgi:thymidylate synthase (FAD)
MRHRTQSFNEVSARYTELKDDYYIPETQQITTQSSQNKQMKTDQVNCDAEEIKDLILKYSESSFIAYKRLLELGCPREMARAVLPMGTYSTMIVTANLLNWFKFIRLRSCEKSQYEIRVYSDSVLEFLRAVAPISCEAFEKYNNG